MILQEEGPTSVPNAPVRRIKQNDKAVLNATSCSKEQTLQLDDKVSMADPQAVFLTGLVAYIGQVHFAPGTWVGIQLIGPSVGKGNCDGTYKGKTYFANVGKKNGMMAPIDVVNHYSPLAVDDLHCLRTKAIVTVDVLTSARAAAILKADEKDQKSPKYKEQIYIRRLKESSLAQAIGVRKPNFRSKSVLKYARTESTLCECDLQLVTGLDKTHQNFCLSDPTLPDNPITYASQAFLDLTGYRLCEILGRNCRFLQGKDTDKTHVDRIRQSIVEGADCHVCLLNYRKDGTPFYNRLFMTALRDTKGRVKNYLGVQCEVDERTAKKINEQEMSLFKAGMVRAGTHFTKRNEKGVELITATSSSSMKSESTESEEVSEALPFSDNSFLDIDEAMFRMCLDDPFAPMTQEEEEWYKKIKTNPYAGYASYKPSQTKEEETA